MATVDTQKSILTYLFNLLTADDDLEAAMGGVVRLYPVWAVPDAEFPYLVHRLDFKSAGETYAVRKGTYYLDIWSDSPNANEALAIRKRIIELLDELVFNTVEALRVHLETQTDGFIPETEPGIWHYATQWNAIFVRKAEAEAIDGR